MNTIGICVATIEGGVVCHQEIGREAVRRRVDNPEIVTHTPRYSIIGHALQSHDFSALAGTLIDSVGHTADAGADFAIIPSNTMHFVFDEVAQASAIPLMNILETTAAHCQKKGFARVGVLGTLPTTQRHLYDPAMAERGIAVSYPAKSIADEVDLIIRTELLNGLFLNHTRQRLLQIAEAFSAEVDAIVLGCTELPLIMEQGQCAVPLVDTTRVFARAALDRALGADAGR